MEVWIWFFTIVLLIWNATCLVTCEYKSQIAFLSSNSTENYTRSHVELYHSKNVLNATKLHRNDVANNTKYFAESIGSQSYHLAFAVLLYSKALARGVYNDTTKEVSLATYRIQSADFVVATTNTSAIQHLKLDIYKSDPTSTSYKYIPNESYKINTRIIKLDIEEKTKFYKVGGVEYSLLRTRHANTDIGIVIRADTPYWFVITAVHTDSKTETTLALSDDTVCDARINVLAFKNGTSSIWQPYGSSHDGYAPVYSISMIMDVETPIVITRPPTIIVVAEPPLEHTKEPVNSIEPITDEIVPEPITEPERGNLVGSGEFNKLLALIIAGVPTGIIILIFVIHPILWLLLRTPALFNT